MKAYNKKNLLFENNNSNNKYSNSIKLTEPNKDEGSNKGSNI